MKRKLIKIGNSFGVVLPKILISEFNGEFGDLLDLEMTSRGFFITFEKTKKIYFSSCKDGMSYLPESEIVDLMKSKAIPKVIKEDE